MYLQIPSVKRYESTSSLCGLLHCSDPWARVNTTGRDNMPGMAANSCSLGNVSVVVGGWKSHVTTVSACKRWRSNRQLKNLPFNPQAMLQMLMNGYSQEEQHGRTSSINIMTPFMVPWLCNYYQSCLFLRKY